VGVIFYLFHQHLAQQVLFTHGVEYKIILASQSVMHRICQNYDASQSVMDDRICQNYDTRHFVPTPTVVCRECNIDS